MRLDRELHGQLARSDAPSASDATQRTRRVSVQLSRRIFEQLEAATERPGIGKSMVIEDALDRFLAPSPSTEAILRDQFEQLNARLDGFERDIRTIAETVTLHARYHLVVTSPPSGVNRPEPEIARIARQVDPGRPTEETSSESDTTAEDELIAAAGEGGSDLTFQHMSTRSAEQPTKAESCEAPKSISGSTSEDAPVRAGAGLRNWRLIGCVFLPFVLGYYLSYVFRTITTAVSGPLMSEFGFDAASMGLLASVYFLSFAAVQIPIGVLLDRYGPRRVQAVLLVLAGGGATLFGTAAGYTDLVVARVLIGVGVAGALMAGLKAIVMWFPKERVAFINGWMIMLGTLGAATATVPADWLLGWTGWRGLFEMLTLVTFAAAGAVYFIVPERAPGPAKPNAGLCLRAVYSDKRFWRIAPLSATCIGSSWAFQSLWAAPWLRDVEGFGQSRITGLMFVMALGVSIGALFLGAMADRLRKRGINAETLLAIVAGLFVFAELALIFQLPIPPTFSWLVISTVGAATVLSYTTIRDYFPAGLAARANGALNLVHFGWAFVAQYGIGLLISLWPPTDGRYPAAAYHLAFGVCVTFQAGALVWFALPWLRVWSIGLCDLLFYDRGDEDSLAFVNCPGEYVTLVGEGGEW